MADTINVGTVISVSASTPATVDASGFAALTYSVVGDLTKWGGAGDTSVDVAEEYLSGRTTHTNGGVDGGTIDFEFAYTLADAGQVILRANNNGQTTISVKELHTDGKIHYYHGKIANMIFREKSPKTKKGQTGIVRINTATIVV